jgi:hypothetical protein
MLYLSLNIGSCVRLHRSRALIRTDSIASSAFSQRSNVLFVQPILAAIRDARQTTLLPGLDASRPKGTNVPCSPSVSVPTELLHHAKEPDIVRQRITEQMCETRTLAPTA